MNSSHLVPIGDGRGELAKFKRGEYEETDTAGDWALVGGGDVWYFSLK